MRGIAFISDIHSNLAALRSTLNHIFETYQLNTEIICLGDVIGYGPQPVECLELLKSHNIFSLNGNHDQAMYDMSLHENTKPTVVKSLTWTMRQLKNVENTFDWIDDLENERVSLRFRNIPDIGQIMLVHASPEDPVGGYLFQRDAIMATLKEPQAREKLRIAFQAMQGRKICFHGHTHHPGVIIEHLNPEQTYDSWRPEDSTFEFSLNTELASYLVNPGSVGQPRNGDPRSSYCIIFPEKKLIRWHRIDYDINETARLIYDNPEIDDSFAERLFRGE